MAKKGGKAKRLLAWCWYSFFFVLRHDLECRYCDREFEDEKVLILHQKAKHFKCLCCSRRLNSASGLVVHMAQIHKETIDSVPNCLPGHDSPEVEIFGMQGVPPEDLQRHYDGLPIAPYKRSGLGEAGLVSLLAAQKAALSGNPLPMSAHIHLKQVPIIEGIGPSQAIPHLPKTIERPIEDSAPFIPVVHGPSLSYPTAHYQQYPVTMPIPTSLMPIASPSLPADRPSVQHSESTVDKVPIDSVGLASVPVRPSFSPVKIDAFYDSKSGKRQPTCFVMILDLDESPEERRASLSKYKLPVND